MGFLEFREPVSAWTHCLWTLLFIPGTILLWQRSRGSLPKQLSLLIFGLSLIGCFAGSTLYHAVHRQVKVFETLDHIGIYLLIAGSCTPMAVVLLRGGWRGSVLALSWLLAGGGILLRLSAAAVPSHWSTGLYLAMGWAFLFCYFELARVLSHQALFPVLAGGVLYSVGAFVNLANWPVLAPSVFGAHELFHLFVMGGSLCHFWFMLAYVVPFESGPRSVSALATLNIAKPVLAPAKSNAGSFPLAG